MATENGTCTQTLYLLPPPSTYTHTHTSARTHTHTLQKANEFRNAVFNDTVNIVEVEEGFDGET